MAIYKNTSCKTVIRKVMRDLKPNNSDWVLDAVEWVGEALEHIGATTQLEKKQCVMTIKDNKCVLPGNLYFINQVAVNSSMTKATGKTLDDVNTKIANLKNDIREYNSGVEDLTSSTLVTADLDKFDTQYKSNVLELRNLSNSLTALQGSYFKGGASMEPLKYGASTFHDSMHCDECVNEFAESADSYIIDGGYIKTSFGDGKVCLSYMAFPVDKDNYPMIPDDVSYKEAMFWYVYKQMLLGGYDKPTNKIDYAFADQKWQHYCSQARNAANFPDIDRYESFMNQWVRLVPDLNRHASFFEDLNTRETR